MSTRDATVLANKCQPQLNRVKYRSSPLHEKQLARSFSNRRISVRRAEGLCPNVSETPITIQDH